MKQVITERVESLDVAKGLGIIAVVLGHSGAPFGNFVYLYHMALFFFISGYFYKSSYTQNPWALVKNRIRTLYLPFIAYGLFFGLLHNYLFSIHIYTNQLESKTNAVVYLSGYKDFIANLVKIALFAKVEQILAPLWFLPILFLVSLLFVCTSYCIDRLISSQKELWLSVSIVALFFLGYNYYPKASLILRPVSIAMVVTIIYYAGYLYRKQESRLPLNITFALICFVVLLVSHQYGAIDTAGHEFTSPHYYLISSLSGIYLNLYLAALLVNNTVLKKFLTFAGKNTIPIMALHFLAFKAVNYAQISFYGLPPYMLGAFPVLNASGGWWVVYLAAGVLLPLGAAAMYARIRLVF